MGRANPPGEPLNAAPPEASPYRWFKTVLLANWGESMKRAASSVPALLMIALLAAKAPAAEFFVAPNGADTQPGTREQPLATRRARRNSCC